MIPRAARLGPLDRILAALAFVLGGGSLLLFAGFLFGVDLGIVRSAGSDALRLLVDAGLCLFFFVQHSVMLRRGFRELLVAVVERRRHGAVYAAASGLALTALVLLWQRAGAPLYRVDGAGRWTLHAVQLLALSSVLWGWRALGGFDPLGITPLYERGDTDDPVPPLSVRGPYRWVRHPLYLAFLVATWATPLLTPDRLLFNVLWTVWIVVGCVLEERDLVARYGDAYRAYRRHTPMLLPWRRPASPSDPQSSDASTSVP